MNTKHAHETVERVVRASYGRLLAYLASRSRNIPAAEDALSEALLSALRHWPTRGIPENPDAWMLAAARNSIANSTRHKMVMERALPDLSVLSFDESPSEHGRTAIPDERLKLMFVCAHPAIDRAIRAPLMLQTVLGLDAVRIGQAFLIPATTMGQRLVRAKAKIRDAGLRFELPEKEDLPDRVEDVLDAVYVAYGVGWEDMTGNPVQSTGLVAEATYLARLTADLMPNQPEITGLLALILYCEARRPARRDANGAFIPLDQQDTRKWGRDLIIEAEGLLTQASRHAQFGRFQCEAAIQSVHVQRAITGHTNHSALISLYSLLLNQTQGAGARIALAAAYLDMKQFARAMDVLAVLDISNMQSHQPYWVIRARVLRSLGDHANADIALEKALSLTQDPSVRDFLKTVGS